MSPAVETWFSRRGIKLTPLGETAVIIGAALIALAWLGIMVALTAAVTDLTGVAR